MTVNNPTSVRRVFHVIFALARLLVHTAAPPAGFFSILASRTFSIIAIYIEAPGMGTIASEHALPTLGKRVAQFFPILTISKCRSGSRTMIITVHQK